MNAFRGTVKALHNPYQMRALNWIRQHVKWQVKAENDKPNSHLINFNGQKHNHETIFQFCCIVKTDYRSPPKKYIHKICSKTRNIHLSDQLNTKENHKRQASHTICTEIASCFLWALANQTYVHYRINTVLCFERQF